MSSETLAAGHEERSQPPDERLNGTESPSYEWSGTRKPLKLRSGVASENRRLRNRLSQQAYRARQTSEVSELRLRVKQFAESESTRNQMLVAENNELRDRLWQCEKKLRSLQANLAGIVDNLTNDRSNNVTDDGGGISMTFGKPHSPPSSDESQNQNLVTCDESLNGFEFSITEPGISFEGDLDGSVEAFTTTVLNLPPATDPGTVLAASASTPSLNEILETTILDECLGSVNFAPTGMNSPSGNPLLDPFRSPNQTTTPLYRSLRVLAPSVYCDHIETYERSLLERSQLIEWAAKSTAKDLNSLIRVISNVVSSFVSLAWPNMNGWFKYTNASEQIAKLTAWRLSPNPMTFAKLPDHFKPTYLQSTVPYPPIIDWVLFPFLRDKLIRFHCADPQLDDICGDIGRAYVVQADLSELIVDAEPMAINVSVWDILNAMEGNIPQTEKDWLESSPLPADAEVKLPAPDGRSLLYRKEYASLLYQHLKAFAEESFRVDPTLFAKYPHFYEQDQTVARGIPLRASNQAPWPLPRPLNSVTANLYLDCASWANKMELLERAATCDDRVVELLS